jgi:hypothetical protein
LAGRAVDVAKSCVERPYNYNDVPDTPFAINLRYNKQNRRTFAMRTLFLARVPILFLLIVTVIASLSLFSGIQPTFLGLFTLDGTLSMFLVAL